MVGSSILPSRTNMNIITLALTISGLAVFETISSVDNAIINADVLGTMQPKARRWFLVWGLLFAVFVIRGVLPWLIIWITSPELGPIGAFTATFSNDPAIINSIETAAPIMLLGGGVFLFLLFLHWFFFEDKNIGLAYEKFFLNKSIWFYSTLTVLFIFIGWVAFKHNVYMAFGAITGLVIFFITQGFKQRALVAGRGLVKRNRSDISKIFYLEMIDASFSIDGVLGAFAFTLSVPLIIIGNGIGAIIVRQLTVGNIERIKKYVFLKNGAMYSILVLGIIMILDAFHTGLPSWISPVITFIIVGYFFEKSRRYNKKGSQW